MQAELETDHKNKLSDKFIEKIHQYSSVRKGSTYFQVGKKQDNLKQYGIKEANQKHVKNVTLAFVHYNCTHKCSFVQHCSHMHFCPELLSKRFCSWEMHLSVASSQAFKIKQKTM